jgi:hypothetical protein
LDSWFADIEEREVERKQGFQVLKKGQIWPEAVFKKANFSYWKKAMFC